jgi:dipeptidyl aminopeptidase/acylaminoacyl peptidase
MTAPPEVVSNNRALDGFTRHTQLTGLDTQELEALVEVEHHHALAEDGVQIPYFVVRPKGPAKPGPAFLWIHGGPRGQSGHGWHWRWCPAILAAAGYVVAQPNPRGSTGLGHDFMHAIWGNQWGAQCYRDLMHVTDALEQRDDVDPHRICAMGGSFGGYMTCWIGTMTDRFACLVTHAPVYSFGQFQVTTDMPAWWVLEIGDDSWSDRDAMERYSPDRGIQNWQSPVLIVHGERDYRCPISESLALFEGLRRHDKPATLAIFPDENHWILKPRNVVAWYNTVLDFAEEHLGAP